MYREAEAVCMELRARFLDRHFSSPQYTHSNNAASFECAGAPSTSLPLQYTTVMGLRRDV